METSGPIGSNAPNTPDAMMQAAGSIKTPTAAELARRRVAASNIIGTEPEQPKASFRPLGNTVVIKAKAKAQTVRGLHVAPAAAEAMARENRRFGVVIAVGPGQLQLDGTVGAMPDINVGDEVVASQVLAVKPDGPHGDEYILVPADSIMAVLIRGAVTPQ